MKILYSKPSIKKMLKMPEKQVAIILKSVKGSLAGSREIKVETMSGFSDKRKLVHCPPYYAVTVERQFKGVMVYYVMDILNSEDLEYYTGA